MILQGFSQAAHESWELGSPWHLPPPCRLSFRLGQGGRACRAGTREPERRAVSPSASSACQYRSGTGARPGWDPGPCHPRHTSTRLVWEAGAESGGGQFRPHPTTELTPCPKRLGGTAGRAQRATLLAPSSISEASSPSWIGCQRRCSQQGEGWNWLCLHPAGGGSRVK